MSNPLANSNSSSPSSSSPSSPSSSVGTQDEYTLSSAKSRVPLWLPISAFVGTSLALGIPILMIARSRSRIKRGLLTPSDAPPRRTAASSSSHSKRAKLPISTTSVAKEEIKPDFSSPGTGELLAAMSRVDFSTAMYAGKAFAIATGIITVFGVGLAVGVKGVMGVNDAQEFGHRMRTLLSTSIPSLSSRIHRPAESDEERKEVFAVVVPGTNVTEEWKWEEAEERMKKAYEEGGFGLWLKVALREMEAERRVEVERKRREERRETE